MLNAFDLTGIHQIRAGRQVLTEVTLSLRNGCATSFIGASGSGKTSLLRLLNRLDAPAAGSMSFLGKPIESYPVRELRRRIGFVFQTPVMFPGTVSDNLMQACAYDEVRHGKELAGRATEVLRLAELSPDYASRDASQLSGGEKQRVALARALMTGPEVLLLDEPTSALDAAASERLITTLARLVADGITIVMATHRLEEARGIGGDTVLFDAGRVVNHGSVPETIFRAPPGGASVNPDIADASE